MTSDSRWIRLLGLIAVLMALSLSRVEAGHASDLGRWTDATLLPWLGEQLERHPRLKGQPVQVGALQGAMRDPAPDGLSDRLVRRIRDSLAARSGVVLVAESQGDWRSYDGSRRLDCRPARERYLIGLEIDAAGAGARVTVRILDLDDNTWATGFHRTWEGRLERDERRLLSQRQPVETLRGQRGLPFGEDQPDLVASRLAAALACDLLAHPAEDLRAAVVSAGDDDPAAAAALLVANYLARSGAVRLVSAPQHANVLIGGETHELGSGLVQLWVSVRPGQPDGDLPSLTHSVYMTGAGATGPSRPVIPPAPMSAGQLPEQVPVALKPIRLLRLAAPCRPADCLAEGAEVDVRTIGTADRRLVVEVGTEFGGDVALLALRPGRGLVRMDIAGCHGPDSVPLPAGARLRHPLFAHHGPGDITLFAVATGSEDARLAVSRLLADVPSDCRGHGLAGSKLDRWLRDLRRTGARYATEMDWRGLRLGMNPSPAQVASR